MSDRASDGLAGMPTGPELGMRLALINPRDTSDEQLPELLTAEYRQLAYQQARVWATMAEIGVRDPMPNRPGGARWTANEIFDNAADEIRAELVLTRRAASTELANACGVAGLLRVMQALSDGVIDWRRALEFMDGCLDLTDVQTEVLLDELLPDAARVTATELAEKIRAVAIALDPEWAQRRYTQAVREQKVVGYLNQDGSATVSGQNLPADEAAMACARVDALADAAKRAGAKAKIDHLRAQLFLGLLDGRFHGMSEPAIIAEMVRQFPKQTEQVEDPRLEPASEATTVQDAVGAARGVHVRVGLGTLLGLDEEPGEVAGWGTVTAPLARRIAGRQHKSEWRFAILDADGELLFDGITRRRPHTRAATKKAVRDGIVELHVPIDLLTDPSMVSRHSDWSSVLTDLAAQYAVQQPIEQDPTARFAGRPLRRRQQTRFQRCLFRGCRRPASDCDLDHRHEHARGGVTDEANTGPGCKHDHKLKTSGGWRLIRRDAHTFVWISPLGRKHVVTIDPVAPPLPKPIPRLLAPEREYPDDPIEPAPTFRPLDQRGRPLTSDPPPF